MVGEFSFKKKEKMFVEMINRDNFYKKIENKFEEIFHNYEITTLDGIKFYNNQEWIHIRLSNTEPILRLVAESRSSKRTDELIAMGRLLINTCQQTS